MIFSSDQIPQTQDAGNRCLNENSYTNPPKKNCLLPECYQQSHFNSIVGFGFISPLKTHKKIRELYSM